jgi:hypothetical protein
MTESKKMSHEYLDPYPTDLAGPSQVFLDAMSGEDVPTNCLIHAAYNGAGAVMGQMFPDDAHETKAKKAMAAAAKTECPDEEKAKELLEKATQKRGPISDMILKQLLAFFMAKINEWLNPR